MSNESKSLGEGANMSNNLFNSLILKGRELNYELNRNPIKLNRNPIQDSEFVQVTNALSPKDIDTILVNVNNNSEITLYGCNLSEKQLNNLCNLIANNTEDLNNTIIKKLRINLVDFTQIQNFDLLCKAVTNSSIDELNLSDCNLNNLSDKNWKLLCDTISHSSVTKLDLEGNSLSNISEERMEILCQSIALSKVTDMSRDKFLDKELSKEINLHHKDNRQKALFVINPTLEQYSDNFLKIIEANRRYAKVLNLLDLGNFDDLKQTDHSEVKTTDSHSFSTSDLKNHIKGLIKDGLLTDEDMAFVVLKHRYDQNNPILQTVLEVTKERVFAVLKCQQSIEAKGFRLYNDANTESLTEHDESLHNYISSKALLNQSLIEAFEKKIESFCQNSYENGDMAKAIQQENSDKREGSRSISQTNKFAIKIAKQDPNNRNNKENLIQHYSKEIDNYLRSCKDSENDINGQKDVNTTGKISESSISVIYQFLSDHSSKAVEVLVRKYATQVYNDTSKSVNNNPSKTK